MPTSDAPGADEAPVETSQETRPAEPPAAPTLPRSPDPSRPDPPSGAHIHQYVRVHVEETADSFVVTRTETVLGHRHGPDLEDAGEHRPARPAARRARGRREWGAPGGPDAHGAGEFVSFGSKSRMPTHLTRAQVDAYLKQERRLALDVRDPVAINFAAERYNTIMGLLAEAPEGETIDLLRPMLSVSQAAKILGYNAKEVRRLLGQGKISGRKVGNEWRIPLRAVL